MLDEAQILIRSDPATILVNGDDITDRIASANVRVDHTGLVVTVELNRSDDTRIEGPGVLYVTRDADPVATITDFLGQVDAELLSSAVLERTDLSVNPMAGALQLLTEIARGEL